MSIAILPVTERSLVTPFPLADALPAIYHESDLAVRLCGALDQVLAPIFWVLDNVDAYFDPHVAPAPFVDWLADWVGLLVDETWPLDLTRQLVSTTVGLYSWRGTRYGLTAIVQLYTGIVPEIVESGGVAWSATPGVELPGTEAPAVLVRLEAADPSAIDRRRLEAIVRSSLPAHVAFQIEVGPPGVAPGEPEPAAS